MAKVKRPRSWTVIWGQLKIASGGLLIGFHYLGDLVTDPEVKSYISTMDFPVYVGLGLAVIGAITIAVRLRPH